MTMVLLIQLAIVDGVGRHFAVWFRTGHIGAEYVLLQGRMTPFPAWSQQSLALAHRTLLESCTVAQMWVAHLGLSGCAQCGCLSVHNPGNPLRRVLVFVQNLFESLAIRFIVEGIRLTQDLLNLCIEPGVGFFCSEVI